MFASVVSTKRRRMKRVLLVVEIGRLEAHRAVAADLDAIEQLAIAACHLLVTASPRPSRRLLAARLRAAASLAARLLGGRLLGLLRFALPAPPLRSARASSPGAAPPCARSCRPDHRRASPGATRQQHAHEQQHPQSDDCMRCIALLPRVSSTKESPARASLDRALDAMVAGRWPALRLVLPLAPHPRSSDAAAPPPTRGAPAPSPRRRRACSADTSARCRARSRVPSGCRSRSADLRSVVCTVTPVGLCSRHGDHHISTSGHEDERAEADPLGEPRRTTQIGERRRHVADEPRRQQIAGQPGEGQHDQAALERRSQRWWR